MSSKDYRAERELEKAAQTRRELADRATREDVKRVNAAREKAERAERENRE